MLQAAEQDAQRIVTEARKGECTQQLSTTFLELHSQHPPDACVCRLLFAAKQDRLREAKAEAEREIAMYRAEREGLFQKKVSEVSWW